MTENRAQPIILEEDDDEGGFVPGLVVGAAVGAALGVLLAPRAGGQTISLLLDRGGELGDRMEEFFDEAADMLRVVALKLQGLPDA